MSQGAFKNRAIKRGGRGGCPNFIAKDRRGGQGFGKFYRAINVQICCSFGKLFLLMILVILAIKLYLLKKFFFIHIWEHSQSESYKFRSFQSLLPNLSGWSLLGHISGKHLPRPVIHVQSRCGKNLSRPSLMLFCLHATRHSE